MECRCRNWDQDELNQAAQLIEDTLLTLHAKDNSLPKMTKLVAEVIQRSNHPDKADHYPPVAYTIHGALGSWVELQDAQTILEHRDEYPVMASRIDHLRDTPYCGDFLSSLLTSFAS